MFQVISNKAPCNKDFTKRRLGGNIFYKFSYKFALIPFLSFRRNEKQEPNFQHVVGLVTRKIYVFCFWQVALYFKGMPDLIDFDKRIFLHVIPARIKVLCK